jgi:hypothetical protein
MVGLAGVEPATYALGMRRSIHVSYSPGKSILPLDCNHFCNHVCNHSCPNYASLGQFQASKHLVSH